MLKLHGFALSNYANIVKQSLMEKGVEFELLDTRPNQEDDFLAISPMGKIPCLETEDGFLIETSVMLDYLDELYPQAPTYPSQAFEKAKAREIIHVVEMYVEVVARRHLGEAFFGGDRSETAYEEVRPQLEKGLRAFQQLSNFGPYVMGSEFGLADIFVYHCFALASQIIKRIYDWDIIAEVPGLEAHNALMNDREITVSVVADRDKAMAALMEQMAGRK